ESAAARRRRFRASAGSVADARGHSDVVRARAGRTRHRCVRVAARGRAVAVARRHARTGARARRTRTAGRSGHRRARPFLAGLAASLALSLAVRVAAKAVRAMVARALAVTAACLADSELVLAD